MISFSNRLVLGPVVIHPDKRVSVTSWTVSPSRRGGENGIMAWFWTNIILVSPPAIHDGVRPPRNTTVSIAAFGSAIREREKATQTRLSFQECIKNMDLRGKDIVSSKIENTKHAFNDEI